MNPRIVLVALSALVIAGCPSPSDQLCKTEQKCNQLKGQTVSQCQQGWDNCVQAFNDGNQICEEIATKWNAYASCAASESCSDVQNPNNGPCSSQWSTWNDAFLSVGTLNCPLSCFSFASDGGSS